MTRPVRTALLLFALALVVRLAVGVWTGLGREPVEDEQGYAELAWSVAYGDGWRLSRQFEVDNLVGSGKASDYQHRDSFRGPVAPVLFAPAALGEGIAAMRLIAILFGALGPPLLFLALRKSSLGEGAWWAGAAYALWPPAIYESVRALSEAPSQAFLIGGIAVMTLERSRAALGGGALAALSVLARPAALLPAALLVLATGSRRQAFAFLLAFMAVLAPWLVRNWDNHGRPLLTTSTGVTLVGGNSRAALHAKHPGKWASPERVYIASSDPPDLGMWGWARLSEEGSDRRFAADALRWVGDNPGDAAKLCFWKVVRLFDPDPHSEKADAGMKALVGWLTLTPVLILAAIGARDAERTWWLLLGGTVLTAVIFYGDTRMRTCADPALLVFAAHGALRLARRKAADVVE